MKLIETFKELCQELSRQTEEAILARAYKVIKVDEYTTTIEAGGIQLAIWMSNEPKNTRLYSFQFKPDRSEGYFYYDGPGFEQPERCREILLTPTAEQREILKAKYQQEIEALTTKLEELS